MSTYFNVFTLFALSIIPTFSLAGTDSKCPKVFQIAAEGLKGVASSSSWIGWMGYNTSQYGTNQMWSLGLFGIEAGSEEEALRVGLNALSTLHLNFGMEGNNGAYLCVYDSPLSDKIQAWLTTDTSDSLWLSSKARYKKESN